MAQVITLTLNTAMDCLISEADFHIYKKDYSKMSIIPAGKGINVSKALASNGEASLCLGFVGINDKEAFSKVSSDLIRCDFVHVEGSTRKNITISECNDGLEHHETNPGFIISEDQLTALENKIFSQAREGDFIIFSGSLPGGIPSNTYRRLIQKSLGQKLIPILDTSKEALREGIKAGPYVIKPNLEELMSLAKEQLSSMDMVKEFIRKLSFDNNIEYVLTTLSKDGALLYVKSEDRFLETPAYEDEEHKNLAIKSSVGCGDCSLAGFIYGLKSNMSVEESLNLSMKWAYFNLYTEIPGDI